MLTFGQHWPKSQKHAYIHQISYKCALFVWTSEIPETNLVMHTRPSNRFCFGTSGTCYDVLGTSWYVFSDLFLSRLSPFVSWYVLVRLVQLFFGMSWYVFPILYIYIYIYGGSHFKVKPKKHSGLFTFSGLPAQVFVPPLSRKVGRASF